MQGTMSTAAVTRRVSWKTVALPAEHGGWGFTSEPVLLGMLVAPSPAGAWLGVAAFGAFLSRHPLKLVLGDLRRGRTFPRTVQAAQVAAGYLAVALLGMIAAFLTRSGDFWPILAAAVPFGLFHLVEDARGRSRALAPEVAGAVAMGSLAPAIALASGWSMPMALGLWLVLAARSLGSIPYVRVQVLRSHRKPGMPEPAVWSAYAGSIVGLAAVVAGAVAGILPWLAVPALALLVVRAFTGLREHGIPARVLGWREIGFGLGTVALTALGSWIGI